MLVPNMVKNGQNSDFRFESSIASARKHGNPEKRHSLVKVGFEEKTARANF